MDAVADKLLWGVKNGDLDTVKQCVEKVTWLLCTRQGRDQHSLICMQSVEVRTRTKVVCLTP